MSAAPGIDGGRTLHLLMRPDPAALEDCRRFCRRGDVVVLIGTGLLSACHDDWRNGFPDGVEFGALEADVLAHGLAGRVRDQRLTLIDETGLAGLVMGCRHALSWK